MHRVYTWGGLGRISLIVIPPRGLLLCVLMPESTHTHIHTACSVHANRPAGWELQPPRNSAWMNINPLCVFFSKQFGCTGNQIDSNWMWHRRVQLLIWVFCQSLRSCLNIDMFCWQRNLGGLYARKHHHLPGNYTVCLNYVSSILDPQSHSQGSLSSLDIFKCTVDTCGNVVRFYLEAYCIVLFHSTADRDK